IRPTDIWSISNYYINKVSRFLNSRLGQYLRQHPVFGLSMLLFTSMAVLPVGLFVVFALVTLVLSVVVFLLFVAGLTLLFTLSGLAFFSVVASVVFGTFYMTITNLYSSYYQHGATVANVFSLKILYQKIPLLMHFFFLISFSKAGQQLQKRRKLTPKTDLILGNWFLSFISLVSKYILCNMNSFKCILKTLIYSAYVCERTSEQCAMSVLRM
uniref:Transmembrane protein 159 n=1 Tax=Periophthalmus magnuspinnatus TaxID=409849 RepID=A0A3B3ZBM1_9GOBI